MGVPYSVLMGRVVGPDDPQWTAADRDVVEAWFTWLDGLCPQCGLPTEVCHDPDAVFEWEGDVATCHVTAVRAKAMSAYRAQINDPDVAEVDVDGVHTVARRRDIPLPKPWEHD